MGNLNFLNSWKEGISEFFSKTNAQSYMKPAFAMASSSCGSSCGAGDKEPEHKPSACGSACGAGDK
ncbi:ACGX-repeat peptide [Clostridium felsineum]|uniref:ACGX-repeat peptide n=1 Tax=Clostridium felsineum TaxID=36839 RepID=UPI00098C2784|nr:ACGX-repeat peptide [Clostridium felsineum]URZ17829.1 hypothetical protein CLFE_038840 [Clostridium felsineum DSM 794]